MDIISKKSWYFALSLLVIIPGLLSLIFWGLRLSIDFTGGSRFIFTKNTNLNPKDFNAVRNSFSSSNENIVSLQTSTKQFIIRTKPINQQTHNDIIGTLQKLEPDLHEESFETVGPTIGNETTWNAIKGVLLASFLIVLYITWAFREVPKPASSLRFGLCAIIALLHDVLVVVGIFSILGHFFGVEIDSLFVTAILTIIGFSVHDTIVVFDRIRENLRKNITKPFATVVNESLLQTLSRSLNTSLTVILVLFALLIFGGESIRWFVAALLIGIISGTYSSIFNASALLVLWDEKVRNKRTQRS